MTRKYKEYAVRLPIDESVLTDPGRDAISDLKQRIADDLDAKITAFIKMYCESKCGKITSREEYQAVIDLFFEHFVTIEGGGKLPPTGGII